MAPRKTKSHVRGHSTPETEAIDPLSIFATQLVANIQKLSFRDLPPEIRNLVYQYVAGDSKATLSRNTAKKDLQSSSALDRVNTQVRHEFKSLKVLTADVHTTVRNFNFRSVAVVSPMYDRRSPRRSHIISFLNRLSDTELQNLCVHTPESRKIQIDLIFTRQGPDYGHLRGRINSAGNPTEKGADVTCQYRRGGYGDRLVDSANAGEQALAPFAGGSQLGQGEEMRMILEALPVLNTAGGAVFASWPETQLRWGWT